jgi:hypothetical protein
MALLGLSGLGRRFVWSWFRLGMLGKRASEINQEVSSKLIIGEMGDGNPFPEVTGKDGS